MAPPGLRVSLSHGKVKKAFLYHPLGPVVYCVFLAGIAAGFLRKPSPNPRPPQPRWMSRILLLSAFLFVCAWAAKLAFIPREYW